MGGLPRSKWFYRVAIWTIPFPLIANSFGWIFTEMGRQPWVVYSQMFTRDGVSPLVGPATGGHVADRADAAVPGAGGHRGRAARALRQGRSAAADEPAIGEEPSDEHAAPPLTFAY